jgi:hypothetical protein
MASDLEKISYLALIETCLSFLALKQIFLPIWPHLTFDF